MDLRLKGKRVLITGGSRGIGYACAQEFAKEGCSIDLVSSSAEHLEEAKRKLAAETGATVRVHALDLSRRDAQESLRPLVGSVDILVNNAGAIPGGGFDQVDNDRWRASWDLKVFGYIEMTRFALPVMMERGDGVIVNVIGAAGAAPRYDYICGSMANAGLIAFTKAVGGHSTSRGVRVLGLNPGPTETERLVKLFKTRAAVSLGDENRYRELLSNLPFGRPARADEIADLVVYLASPRASYLSGLVIDAEGGALYRG